MLKIIPIFVTFCCVSAQLPQTNKVVLPLTPEQIRNTFDNVMSDEYIRILAQDFASKAAEHFVKEMGNQKAALATRLGQMYRSPMTGLSTEKLQEQLQALQKAQAEAQAMSQAQVQAKATALVQAQIQAQQKAQAELQAQQKAKAEAEAKAQAELEEKDEEIEEHQQIKQPEHVNNNPMLDSHEALNLLREPEPDGDHLDSQSGELSGEATREKIPVIQVMKINGAYYRRLLGLI